MGVGVNDYGEDENKALIARFDMTTEDFPQYRLFTGAEVKVFKGDITVGNLTAFVTQHTDVYIALPGQLQAFDDMATAYMAGGADERAATLKQATEVHDAA